MGEFGEWKLYREKKSNKEESRRLMMRKIDEERHRNVVMVLMCHADRY